MKLKLTALATIAALSAGSALAAPMVPTYDTFGDLPGATFGGTGIPTDPTAITVLVADGTTTITLGMTAHQRFDNPALTNDGAGTFFAQAGANDGTPGNPGTAATWNFAFYVNVSGPNNVSDYQFTLLYDLDPGAGTDESAAGSINLNLANLLAGGAANTDTLQDSQNATFGFLCGVPPLPGIVTPPASCPFDPFAGGEYSFALIASDFGGPELGRAAINVVVDAVPEPAPLALLGLGLAGLAFSRRRKA